ncbi:beta-lactamase/transpeptidase-like protein [Irpex rosettiformis]|uniref:Beta-lactamase/transpeptidase-like protein n=1 Tax=Irpex rosettiformis TaxID=378272 RepID=A0ACB8U9I8_9APHY|nr:beta-lactamase/transpeptidase-like protein [Irpex rosettiformis]
MQLLKRAFQLWLSLSAISPVLAQQPYSAGQDNSTQTALTPEVRKFIEDTRINSTAAGISVAVIHSDGRVELEGFGKSSEEGNNMTADTLVVIGSTSKAFASASIGILMDDFAHGRNVTPLPNGLEILDWHTKLKDILPDDWKLMDEWASEKASIRDILSHVSGLSRHDLQFQQNDSTQDITRRLQYLRPSWELREQYHYNNQMYMVATYIVSLYSNLSYPDFVKERIFKPLGMSTSTFRQAEASQSGLLAQFFDANGRRIPFPYPEYAEDMIAGPGGVISSARDLAKWVAMLLNEGVDPITNKTILPKSVFEEVTSGWSLISSMGLALGQPLSAYGHGWIRYSLYDHEIVEHDGGLPGAETRVGFLPDDGVGVVILFNTSDKTDQTASIFLRILEQLLKIPGPAPGTDAASVFPELVKVQGRATGGADEELPIEAYAGVYYNPGYYNITLCPATVPSKAENTICKDTLEAFSYFEDVSASNDTLYVALSSLWTQQSRLHRVDGNRFQLRLTYLFPHGYGNDTSPFELTYYNGFNSNVTFVVEDNNLVTGFALDSFDVEGVVQRKKGNGSIEEKADVWFDKIL